MPAPKPRAKPAAKKAAPKPRQPRAHKRTPANERVLGLMLRANASCTHALLAEAIGVSVSTLQRHYGDLIPHEGPGRPEHVPTDASRLLVEQHKALGLKHTEIAELVGIEKGTLELHYKHELTTALARTKGLIGSQIVARALSRTDKDAQRAAEFFMERMGGWVSKSKVGVGIDPAATGDEEPTLVGPTRADARKVALLLYAARRTEVVTNERVEEEPSNGRG